MIKRWCVAFAAGLLALLALSAPAPARDTKEAADEIIHRIRALQAADGLYGESLVDTCRVLDVLARSPRRYTELDGPFFRVPAQRVAQADAAEVSDALVVLALAGTVTTPLQSARQAALERTRAAGPGDDYERWLALRTFHAEDAIWPAASEGADAGLQCLAAEDPSTVAAPSTEDVAAWTRWARAARLRGVKPTALPALPSVDETSSLSSLILALETVTQMHGLPAAPGAPATADGDDAPPPHVSPGRSLDEALSAAWSFLGRHQDGGRFGLEMPGWSGPEPGVTALCLSAACWLAERLEQPRPDWVGEGLDYLVSLQKPDGSVRMEGLDVYTTSVAVEALLAGGRERDRPVIERAREFLLVAQADEGEGYDPIADPHYGGIGYGNDERPDLSNTQMAVEAAARAGAPADAAFFDKVLVFLQRCQNLSEGGAQSWPRAGGGRLVTGNDGGATYMPGNSVAGEVRIAEGLYQARSYGSMTYALAKSYILCGVPPDDERLAAAVRWLAEHFSVTSNPGFEQAEDGDQGLYYYYLALARTLRLLPADGFRDAAGAPIPWREALSRQLLDQQRIDGSWINAGSPRWWEGAPTLCTAYALLALQAAEG